MAQYYLSYLPALFRAGPVRGAARPVDRLVGCIHGTDG